MSSPQCSLVCLLSQVVVSECMRPPTRPEASYTVDAMPASFNVSAALRPAMPPPTIAILGAEAAAARDASGPPMASAPNVAPPALRKSRRLRLAFQRSVCTSGTDRPDLSASSKSANSCWKRLRRGVRAIGLPPLFGFAELNDHSGSADRQLSKLPALARLAQKIGSRSRATYSSARL